MIIRQAKFNINIKLCAAVGFPSMYIFNYFSLIEKIIGRAKGMSLAIIPPLGLDINTSLS